MAKYFDYIYIFSTIAFTVYGQVIIKWRISQFGELPTGIYSKLAFLIKLLVDFYILSGFLAAFVASLSWMASMTKFDLNHAYPFMSLNFVIVLLLSSFFLSESINTIKIFGVFLIIAGVIVSAQG